MKSNARDQLGFLQKLYVALDEPDGVAGVCAIRDHEPSLEENITAYEATGRLQDAFSCYERISQREDCSLEFYKVCWFSLRFSVCVFSIVIMLTISIGFSLLSIIN